MRRSQEIASQADEDFRSNLLMSSDHQNCARVKNYFDKQHNSLALFVVPHTKSKARKSQRQTRTLQWRVVN